MTEAIIAFSILTLTFGYLAVNTTEKYAELQIGNYIITYVMALFTGFLAFAFTASGENPAGLLSGWTSGFSWMVVLVVAVFLIRILNNILEATGKEVL